MSDNSQKKGNALLENKLALVTGAGRGIGREIAHQLAIEGADVIITARNQKDLEKLEMELKKMGRQCWSVAGDICDAETTQRLLDVVNQCGRLDILVNNAGVLDRDGTLKTTVQTFEQMLQVNLVSVFRVTQALLPELIKRKGSVINITSSASRAPHPNANPAYGVSKAGVTALTRQWAMEFAAEGVRVNAVQCGPIETDMSTSWTQEYREKVMAAVPLHRLGTPWDAARSVVFLASEQAAYITGASINVNGGKLME